MKIALGLIALVAIIALLGTGVLWWQGRQKPQGDPRMVAMGSSYAAGIGLGARVAGSPFVCMRTVNSYPQQLARLLHLPLVDMTCSGARTVQILHGGPMFLRPQIDGVGPDTELVTVTTGGNDIGYVGDLSLLAVQRAQGFKGWAARLMTRAPDLSRQRAYAKMQADLAETLAQVRARAPRARIVVVTYPTILPPQGTCAKLNLTEREVSAMRDVGGTLAQLTRATALAGGAIVVDMHHLGAAHHACAPEPWINGWNDANGAPFHPTLAGATATAQAIAAELAHPL